MKISDVPKMRLMGQHIAGRKFSTVKEVVSWMAGMQAQDFEMAEWAVGVRLPGSTEKMIESAVDRGEIIRTHLMRPTWHFVSSDDVHWMLELTAPQIKSSLKSRESGLGLNEKNLSRYYKIIEDALSGGNNLTREELVGVLKKNKIKTEDNRASHIFLNAELNGIMCSGKVINKKQTYALLRERVPVVNILKREEAAGRLVLKYFLSRGPATLEDFVWWSGLPVKDARNGLECVKHLLTAREIDSKTYWMSDEIAGSSPGKNAIQILPAFDEFLISYKDRSATVDVNNNGKTVSNNGIFRPFILNGGKVTGIWKRIKKKDEIIIETEFFKGGKKIREGSIKKLFGEYGKFLGKKIKELNKN